MLPIPSSIGVILCQSIVRQRSAAKKASLRLEKLRHEHQVACATTIQSIWRGLTAQRLFVATVSKLVLMQSVIRRWIARRLLAREALQRQRLVSCATAVQARWKTFVVHRQFAANKRKVIKLQSIVRMWATEKHFIHCKKSITKISSQWRKFQRCVRILPCIVY